MRTRTVLAALVGVVTAVIVTACSGNTEDSAGVSGEFSVTQVDVNGKRVTCITWADYKKGGLSCDWANAK